MGSPDISALPSAPECQFCHLASNRAQLPGCGGEKVVGTVPGTHSHPNARQWHRDGAAPGACQAGKGTWCMPPLARQSRCERCGRDPGALPPRRKLGEGAGSRLAVESHGSRAGEQLSASQPGAPPLPGLGGALAGRGLWERGQWAPAPPTPCSQLESQALSRGQGSSGGPLLKGSPCFPGPSRGWWQPWARSVPGTAGSSCTTRACLS